MFLTKEHDSRLCTCEMCAWADDVQQTRARYEWSLEAEMNNFSARYGAEELCKRIEVYMTEKGLY